MDPSSLSLSNSQNPSNTSDILIHLFTAPRTFDIVECNDCSITFEWTSDVLHEVSSYELDHRAQGIDDWSVRKLSSEDVFAWKNGRHMYTLQNLQPNTYYNFRLRSVHDHVKSHYSKTISKTTLELGNKIFGFTFQLMVV